MQIPVQIGKFGEETSPTNGKFFALRQLFTKHTDKNGNTIYNGNLSVIADESVLLNTYRIPPSSQSSSMKTANPEIAELDRLGLYGIGYRNFQPPDSYSTRNYATDPLPEQNGIPILPLVSNGAYIPAAIWDTSKFQLLNMQIEPISDMTLGVEWLVGNTHLSLMKTMLNKWFNAKEMAFRRRNFTMIIGDSSFLES